MVHPILLIFITVLILSVPVFLVLLLVKGKPKKRMPILGWLLIILGALFIYTTAGNIIHYRLIHNHLPSYFSLQIPNIVIYLMMIFIGWKIR